MSADTGGSAFPLHCPEWHEAVSNAGVDGCDLTMGMTLRDYFAAKAMQASRSRSSQYGSWDDLAKDAYEIADAMLKARST
jgi:hypothetical protein